MKLVDTLVVPDVGIDIDLLEDYDLDKVCEFGMLLPGYTCSSKATWAAVFSYQGCEHDGDTVYLCNKHTRLLRIAWKISKFLSRFPRQKLHCLKCGNPTLKNVSFYKL
jgi:hypothetical protein